MRADSRKDGKVWASLKNIHVYIDQHKILSDININLRYGENILILIFSLSESKFEYLELNIPENPELIT